MNNSEHKTTSTTDTWVVSYLRNKLNPIQEFDDVTIMITDPDEWLVVYITVKYENFILDSVGNICYAGLGDFLDQNE
jgi:hypothetical protein